MAAQMRAAEYKGLSEEDIQKRERQKEVRKIKNIEMLEDTLEILGKGSYDQVLYQRIRLFDSIDFAVLCRPEKDYNYREFCGNFLQKWFGSFASINIHAGADEVFSKLK